MLTGAMRRSVAVVANGTGDPVEPRETHEQRDRIQILDVREPSEWSAGHIDGAVHIPMGDLAARQQEIATDRKIVCVCRSGSRSGHVAQALLRAGYDAHNMEGGMKAWSKAGLPFITDDGTPARVA